jgi:ATP synthase protein I
MPSDHKPETSGKVESSPPNKEKAKDVSNPLVTAMELPFVLVSAVVVGGLFGYFLDRWLHTKPVFMLILGGIGFFAGVRDILRRLPGGNDGTKAS